MKRIIIVILVYILIVGIATSCSHKKTIDSDEDSTVEYSDLWLSPPFIQKNNEWVYYTQPFGGTIYKMKQNGKGKTEVDDLSAHSFLFNGDYLYYTKMEENKICSYKLDDSEQTILTEKVTLWHNREIAVMNGWLYYQSPGLECARQSLMVLKYTVLAIELEIFA